jgi:hypothetical protein
LITDSVNQRPEAQIEKVDLGPHYKGSVITFQSDKSRDQDGDRLTALWSARECDDATTCDPVAVQDASLNLGQEFELTVPGKRNIAVQLRVEDPRGASGIDIVTVEVVNRIPTVQIQPQGTKGAGGAFVLLQDIEVVAAAVDDDDDPLTLSWELFPAPGSAMAAREWEMLAEDRYRLKPDVEGVWMVRVTADDGFGGVFAETATIVVASDQEPCISMTDPTAIDGARYIVERSKGPRRFAVLQVVDDLDPYPVIPGANESIGVSTFAWQIASPDTSGVLVPITSLDSADYILDPAAFAPGDLIELRVETNDRLPHSITCADTDPFCDNGCLRRVTWSVEIR